MNYYERHLGDYARDTGHLSPLEHGVYTLLLDRYYASESPIPANQAHRVARARSRDERVATDAVLSEFFVLDGDVYRNRRADAVIAQYLESEPDREAKKANARERQQRARAHRADLFEQLRELGEVPRYDANTSELVTLLKRVTSRQVTQPVTRDDTATHHPVTSNHQEQELQARTLPPEPPAQPATGTEAGRACLLIRQAGCVQANPSHPDLLAALAEGVTPEALRDTVAEGIAAGKTNPFVWAIRTARSRHAEGPQPVIGATHADHRPSRKLSAVEQVEQAIRERRATEAGTPLAIGHG